MAPRPRFIAVVLCLSIAGTFISGPRVSGAGLDAEPVLYTLPLPGGKTATVYADGRVRTVWKDATGRLQMEERFFSGRTPQTPLGMPLPDKDHLLAALMKPKQVQPFAPNEVVVVFLPGIQSNVQQSLRTLTTDASTNRVLSSIGADRIAPLYQSANHSQLVEMESAAQAALQRPIVHFSNAFRLHVVGSSVREAVKQLLKLPSVEYASPNWYVTGLSIGNPVTIPNAVRASEEQRAFELRTGTRSTTAATLSTYVPNNYALASSMQSLHNTPSVDSAAAFDEIQGAFHQLPGQGETITNVSLGDLDDASAATNGGPCQFWVQNYGPTTEMIGGQRYLNWPSMPLIPTYTANDSAQLNGKGEVCGVDPSLTEVGLDFSMMAPLPHELQRSREIGSGATDLLGIAPGANYRLVVPGNSAPTMTDVQGAFLAAAAQSPRTNVITASLGFGYDIFGFSGRYLEDDPLTESIVAGIVNADQIVVCIAAGDGIRTFTPVAVGASGGTVPTNVAPPGGTTTSLDDVAFSGYPSYDHDSGAIDVGGSTLDDIFADPPQYLPAGGLQAQHAFPETRYSGLRLFSSGDGSRVDISAPADNVISLSHQGNNDDSVQANIEGGTSASAPQVAAAAAVVLQVSRLTGHAFRTATDVRRFLEKTAKPIPNDSQADTNISVGPQVDVTNAVETLLRQGGRSGTPNVPRVAIEQRRDFGIGFDNFFISDTNPNNIDLNGDERQSWPPFPGTPGDGSDADQLAFITIAPDWEWLHSGVRYRFFPVGRPSNVIATTPWARILPKAIFDAAGIPIVGTGKRTIALEYDAVLGSKIIAGKKFSLTFGPADATIFAALSPKVSPVVKGNTVTVSYDLTQIQPQDVHNPHIFVTLPGRFSPDVWSVYFKQFIERSLPLPSLKGTITLPASLFANGGGVYGISIGYYFPDSWPPPEFKLFFSNPALIRFQPQSSPQRPLPPALSETTATPSHFLEIPFNGSVQISYDAGGIPGATGALLEVSAPGPGLWNVYNPFSNPEGTTRDQNGADTGSVYYERLPGVSGKVTLSASQLHLLPTFLHTLRVIPTAGGISIGEASDVSTIIEDGIPAFAGGTIFGFGINQNGDDGFIASAGVSGNVFDSTIENIDTTAMRAAAVDYTSPPSRADGALSHNPIFGDDLAALVETNFAAHSASDIWSYKKLNVAKGSVSAWNFPYLYPPAFVDDIEGGADSAHAVVRFDDTSQPYSSSTRTQLVGADLLDNTFDKPIPVEGPVASFGSPYYFHQLLDTKTDVDWLTGYDLSCTCKGIIVGADLTTGKLVQFPAIGTDWPWSIPALDEKNSKLGVATNDGGLSIYDLSTHMGSEVPLAGTEPVITNAWLLANDPVHKIFLVDQIDEWPEFYTNHNAIGHLLLYDEQGHLLANREVLSVSGSPTGVYPDYGFQVLPSRRLLFTYSWDGTQVMPVKY